jgi:hypothetical protein
MHPDKYITKHRIGFNIMAMDPNIFNTKVPHIIIIRFLVCFFIYDIDGYTNRYRKSNLFSKVWFPFFFELIRLIIFVKLLLNSIIGSRAACSCFDMYPSCTSSCCFVHASFRIPQIHNEVSL